MLKKKNRANKKEVENIFKKGKFLNSSNLTFKFILNGTSQTCGDSHMSDLCSNPPRISFIAPKNIAKLAVKRNYLRRRGYFALKKYLEKFPDGITGVFIFKKFQDDLLIIENEIKSILAKIN